MIINPGFELMTICGEAVIVAHGVENIDFSKIISLNESAAYLWEKVHDHEFTDEELVRLLMEEYEVDEATALTDVRRMMQDWKDAGLAS